MTGEGASRAETGWLSETEIAERLEEVSTILRAWYASRGSDSVREQNLREREYARACELFEGLPFGAKRLGKAIQLTIGNKQMDPVYFDRNAYDFVETHYSRYKLEPGDKLQLKHEKRLRNLGYSYESQFDTFYLGDFRSMLEVAVIAETLSQGGSIELVDSEAEPEV